MHSGFRGQMVCRLPQPWMRHHLKVHAMKERKRCLVGLVTDVRLGPCMHRTAFNAQQHRVRHQHHKQLPICESWKASKSRASTHHLIAVHNHHPTSQCFVAHVAPNNVTASTARHITLAAQADTLPMTSNYIALLAYKRARLCHDMRKRCPSVPRAVHKAHVLMLVVDTAHTGIRCMPRAAPLPAAFCNSAARSATPTRCHAVRDDACFVTRFEAPACGGGGVSRSADMLPVGAQHHTRLTTSVSLAAYSRAASSATPTPAPAAPAATPRAPLPASCELCGDCVLLPGGVRGARVPPRVPGGLGVAAQQLERASKGRQ